MFCKVYTVTWGKLIIKSYNFVVTGLIRGYNYRIIMRVALLNELLGDYK